MFPLNFKSVQLQTHGNGSPKLNFYINILSLLSMDHVVRIHDLHVPSSTVACDRFTNYVYRISLSKLCIGDGFPVGYSFLVLDMKGLLFYKIKTYIYVIACSSMKGS